MNSLFTGSIRSTLVLLVLLAVLPALGIILYDGVLARSHALQDATDKAGLLAQSTAALQERITDNIRQILADLAETPLAQAPSRFETSAFLAKILDRNPLLRNILIADLQGEVIASALPFEKINIADRNYFQAAVRRQAFSAGEYIVGRIAFTPGFSFAAPIVDTQGKVASVIAATLKLGDIYAAHFNKINLPENSIVIFADRNATRTYRYPSIDNTLPLGERIHDFVWQSISRQNERGTFTYGRLDGISRIFSYAQLRLDPEDSPYLYVIIGIPEREAQAEANTHLYRNVALLGLATLLALMTVWIVGGLTLGRRIECLVATTERVGRGDLAARCDSRQGSGELDRLARSVNAMAEALAHDRDARALVVAQARDTLEQKVRARTEELRQALEAQQARERLHRVIVENSPLGMIFFDNQGVIVTCNDKFVELMGAQREQLIGFNTAQQSSLEMRETIKKALAGEVAIFEGPYTSVTGGKNIFLRVCFNPVQPGVSPTEVIATLEDVTERREKDAELRRLWNTVERCPASIVITDAGARIQYVNPYFTVNTGYSAEEALGKNPRILQSGVHPSEFYKAMWKTLLTGQTWRGEFCNKKKTGESYWEDATISPIRNEQGKITHYIAVKEDVTERKRHESEMKKAISELEALFHNSAVAIIHIERGRVFHRVNNRALELFGYSTTELVGQSAELLHISPEHFQHFEDAYSSQLAAGELVQVEYQLRRSDGRPIWCSLYGKALNPPDLDAGVIWVIDDITPRKELEGLREDVERIMRHDLKSPLNGIINFPQLIASEGNLKEHQLELLGYIEEAGQRMLDQIDLSLDLYKIETGAYDFSPVPVDLCATVARVVRDLDSLAGSIDVLIDVFVQGRALVASDRLFVAGNSLFCASMLANIVKNAIEASPPDGRVSIHIEQGDCAVVAVHNQCAVPEHIRPVFFEKYVTSGKTGGTGLGTYSARLLAQAQGGSIELDSSDEAGATVTIRLPLDRSAAI